MHTAMIPSYVHELLIASGNGLNTFTTKLSEILSLPVIVTDPLFNVQSCSNENEPVKIVDATISYEQTELLRFELCSNNIFASGIGSTISINQKALGYLLIISGNEQVNLEEYKPIIQYAASLCALHFERKMELRQERLKLKDGFLFDLLYGNVKQKEDIIEYGKLWNWDLTVPNVVIVFSIHNYDNFTGDKQWMNVMLRMIEKVLIQKNIKPITMLKTQEVIAILPLDHSHPSKIHSELVEFAGLILNHVEGLNMPRKVSCGIGKAYDNPTELFRSYQEAKVAYEMGLSLDEEISFFDRLGLERIIYKHDLQDLKEFYYHTLGDLQQYDMENGTDLMDTLESYAANEYDIQKTSQVLYLHRNTLRYRIKKIEEILNLKLDPISVKTNISTAFKIKKLRNM